MSSLKVKGNSSLFFMPSLIFRRPRYSGYPQCSSSDVVLLVCRFEPLLINHAKTPNILLSTSSKWRPPRSGHAVWQLESTSSFSGYHYWLGVAVLYTEIYKGTPLKGAFMKFLEAVQDVLKVALSHTLCYFYLKLQHHRRRDFFVQVHLWRVSSCCILFGKISDLNYPYSYSVEHLKELTTLRRTLEFLKFTDIGSSTNRQSWYI